MKNKNWQGIILGILIFLYILWFSYFSILRHETIYSSYYDLGIMDQTVFNTSQGRFLEMTDTQDPINVKRMAIHNDPLLALLAPFYFIYSGPETLLVIQSIVLGFGALGIYLLSNKILSNKNLSLTLSFAYLMYVPMQRANIFDFHAVTLATAFLIFMFYFAYIKKYFWSFIFLMFAILAKEQVAISTFLFGLYMQFFFPKDKKNNYFNLLVIIFSLFWIVFSFKFIIPFYAKTGEHFAISRFSHFGGNSKEVLTGILFNPKLVMSYLINWDNLRYIWFLFGPLLFTSVLSPFIVLIPIFEFGINMLSNDPNMKNIIYHYTSVITPFIFIAAIFGIKKIEKKINEKLLIFIFLLTTILFSIFKSPLPYSFEKEIHPFLYPSSLSSEISNWSKKLKDKNLIVATTPQIAPHFTQRTVFYIFDKRYIYADYIVISTKEIEGMTYPYDKSISLVYQALLNNKNFEKIYSNKNLEVYKKK